MSKAYDIDTTDLKKLQKDLRFFAADIYPLITRDTLNHGAFETMFIARRLVSRRFTLRNKWTQRSILVEKATGTNVNKMQSKTGSTMDYMRDQELSGEKRTKGSGAVAIPQKDVRTGKSHARTIPKRNYIKSLRLVKGPFKRRFSSKKARVVAMMIVAKQKKLAMKMNDNIYTVDRISTGGGKASGVLRRVYHVGKDSVRIPAMPWLMPSAMKGQKKMQPFFFKSTKFHMRRVGLR